VISHDAAAVILMKQGAHQFFYHVSNISYKVELGHLFGIQYCYYNDSF